MHTPQESNSVTQRRGTVGMRAFKGNEIPTTNKLLVDWSETMIHKIGIGSNSECHNSHKFRGHRVNDFCLISTRRGIYL
jgi:hypothetical protein